MPIVCLTGILGVCITFTGISIRIYSCQHAAVLYTRVRTSYIEISSLSSYAELSFESWFPSKKVYVAELSAPMYSLNIANDRITSTLKILDWTIKKPVVEGWVALSLEYTNCHIAYSRVFYGDNE